MKATFFAIGLSLLAIEATAAGKPACIKVWSEIPAGLNFAHTYVRNECGKTVKIFWSHGGDTLLAAGAKMKSQGGFTATIYD